jgi:uncharacterized protein YecT (DUF1311 family)
MGPVSVFAALCLLLLSPSAFSASFDCAKAATRVEKLVCTSPQLSKLDSDLGDLYKEALAKDASIRQDQVAWLRQRNQCADANCLQSAYADRIDELMNFVVRFDRQALAGGEPNKPAQGPSCEDSPLDRGCPLSFLASEGLFWTEGKASNQSCASFLKRNADQSFFAFAGNAYTVFIPGAKFQKEFAARYEITNPGPTLRFQVIKKVNQATITTPYQYDKARKVLVQTRKSDCVNCSKAQLIANDQGLESLVECKL